MYHILFTFLISFVSFFSPADDEGKNVEHEKNIDNTLSLYEKCNLDGKLTYCIFENAIESLDELEFDNENLITIIDFSKPSTEKRLYVIDLKNQKLLYHTLVAHGKNSGMAEARKFSNTNRSLQSSLGIYSTAEIYFGKHGYSLRLDGLEKGFNDNARKRAIVIHGAKYVSTDFIKDHGRLGRSWGCPAIPTELTNEIIDLIKGGSCLYIYADDENYLDNSIIFN
jgi:hypothetical protein